MRSTFLPFLLESQTQCPHNYSNRVTYYSRHSPIHNSIELCANSLLNSQLLMLEKKMRSLWWVFVYETNIDSPLLIKRQITSQNAFEKSTILHPFVLKTSFYLNVLFIELSLIILPIKSFWTPTTTYTPHHPTSPRTLVLLWLTLIHAKNISRFLYLATDQLLMIDDDV